MATITRGGKTYETFYYGGKDNWDAAEQLPGVINIGGILYREVATPEPKPAPVAAPAPAPAPAPRPAPAATRPAEEKPTPVDAPVTPAERAEVSQPPADPESPTDMGGLETTVKKKKKPTPPPVSYLTRDKDKTSSFLTS